jgi:hypothetical protein
MDEQLLSETFVELTDTMVAGFDMIDFLHVLTDRSVSCWSCSCCKTSRVRAWTASGPASPSPPPT